MVWFWPSSQLQLQGERKERAGSLLYNGHYQCLQLHMATGQR